MATQIHRSRCIGRVLMGLAVLLGLIGVAGGGSWANDNELSRQTLRGVEGVDVLVEALGAEVERAGLATQQLQTDVELRLRQSGIRVHTTKEEGLKTPGRPLLYINANVILHSEGGAVYNIHVDLVQRAFLETDGSRAIVSTWSVGMTGFVGNVRLVDVIRNNVRDRVDDFINAYLSVHPRPAGSATPASTSPRRNLVR